MPKTCHIADGWVSLFMPVMSIPDVAACRMLTMHQAVYHLGEPVAKAVIQAHILTGDGYMSKLGNEHTAVVCDM